MSNKENKQTMTVIGQIGQGMSFINNLGLVNKILSEESAGAYVGINPKADSRAITLEHYWHR